MPFYDKKVVQTQFNEYHRFCAPVYAQGLTIIALVV